MGHSYYTYPEKKNLQILIKKQQWVFPSYGFCRLSIPGGS